MKLLKAAFQLVALIVVVTWAVRLFDSYYRAYNVYGQIKSRYESKRQELDKLKAEMVKKSDPFYVEGQIRDNLGLVKDGEKIIVLKDGGNVAQDVLGAATRAAELVVKEQKKTIIDTVRAELSKLPLVGTLFPTPTP